jgi:hypothetical protein
MTYQIDNNGFHNYFVEFNPEEFMEEDSVETYTKTTYKFNNHFHPFVGEFLEQLNKESLAGLLDVKFQKSLVKPFFKGAYSLCSPEKISHSISL